MKLEVLNNPVRPFSNGSQHADWEMSNCDRCTKNTPEGIPTCEIQRAICDAAFGNGAMSASMAKRMGYSNPIAYVWQCAEVVWTEEWKAEHRRRQTYRYRIAKWWRTNRLAFRKWRQEKVRKIRERWRMPIAEREGLHKPDTCWADWCSWAIGYGDKPEGGRSRCCADSAECGSCWCGKFQDGRLSKQEGASR